MTRGVDRGVACVRQPSPQRNPGGDCFACSLQAALAHLCPERDAPTFEDTDRWFQGEWAKQVGSMETALRRIGGGDIGEAALEEVREVVATLDRYETEPPTNNTWKGMQLALEKARWDGWPIETTIDMVVPQFDIRQWGYCWPIVWAGSTYARRLEAWLAAGWLALTNVNYEGAGPLTPDLKLRGGDHFVLLDGVREREGDPYWNNPELHIVCSAKGRYWIDTQKWERGYGGVPWLLVRRIA